MNSFNREKEKLSSLKKKYCYNVCMHVFLWRQQKKLFRQKTLFSPWSISSFASHRLLWWRWQFNYCIVSDATADICSHNIPCCFSDYCWFTMDSACWRPASTDLSSLAARLGGKRGELSRASGGPAHMHVCACQPATCVSGAAHTPACQPPSRTARFWIGHSPVVGCGLEVGDPWDR